LVLEKNFPSIQSIREMREAEPLNDAMLTAKIRARVWETKIPELLDPSTPLVIPEADIEIDIDLENSMEALRELDINEPMGLDRLYLYGYGIHDRTISKDWRTAVIETIFDYSNTEEGEFRVMSQMWNKLQEEISKAESTGRTIKIFHYANHEFMWWTKFANRFAGKTGVPTITEVDTFKGNYLIDLLPYARRISFPAMDSSIKSLAPLAGFEWEVHKAGGANSLLKYKQATTSKSQAERDEAIAWLDSYNRDDVRATFAVRNYMRSLTMPGKALWSPE
jgi:predicted RecB family nuclease